MNCYFYWGSYSLKLLEKIGGRKFDFYSLLPFSPAFKLLSFTGDYASFMVDSDWSSWLLSYGIYSSFGIDFPKADHINLACFLAYYLSGED